MDKKLKDHIRELQKTIDNARSDLEQIRDEVQSDFDEKSDTWREGDKGQEAEEKLNSLTDAVDTLETVVSSIEEALA